MKKGIILVLYGVALYFVLKRFYSNKGNTGLPEPSVIAAPTYLYAILALVADFTGGFTIPLAAGMTVALIWQTNAQTKEQSQLQKQGAVYVGPSGPQYRKFPNDDPGMHPLPPKQTSKG